MTLPRPYLQWQARARELLAPLAALMSPGRAELPISGRASDHDAQADRLESFARPLLLAAFYLQSEIDQPPVGGAVAAPRGAASAQPTSDEGDDSVAGVKDAMFRNSIAEWFRRGLVIGTHRGDPHYWGADANYHQHHVEMGLMAIALQIAPEALWHPLTPGERAQVSAWFGTARGGGIVNNNHLFMSVHILEFLEHAGFGRRSDRAVITAHLDQLETMHRGGGWFEDGINQAYDHYNAYAFHFYGLMWTRLHGAHDPARAQRWREWARLFVDDYQYFFAASGEHPAFGRSITYRFNAINVFGLALTEKCTDLPPGMLRRLCTRNLEFFLSRPITQEQGCLASGFTDHFDAIVEPYSCAASPYWAAKGFTPLLLPSTHPFWHDAEVPLPSEREFVRVMPTPGLVVRSIPGGAVELLNAGSMVGNTQTRYGPWKWSKLAYRTGAHFTYSFPEATTFSLDNALTAEIEDGRIFGRHSTVAIEIDPEHIGYSYNLGSKVGQVNTSVETFVWWRAGWVLHVHHIEPRQPVVLRLGGFALPLAGPGHQATDSEAWSPDGRGTVLQSVSRFNATEWDARLDNTLPRRHVAAPYHVTPVLKTGRVRDPVVVAALSWIGRDRAESAVWRIVSANTGEWQLVHPTLGSWSVSHWSLPSLTTTAGGTRIEAQAT
jgi:hypothetical protein